MFCGGLWHMGGLGFPLMWIGGILLFLLILMIVFWIINAGQKKQGKNSALDLLKERYAQGEIDQKEFLEKKKDLE